MHQCFQQADAHHKCLQNNYSVSTLFAVCSAVGRVEIQYIRMHVYLFRRAVKCDGRHKKGKLLKIGHIWSFFVTLKSSINEVKPKYHEKLLCYYCLLTRQARNKSIVNTFHMASKVSSIHRAEARFARLRCLDFFYKCKSLGRVILYLGVVKNESNLKGWQTRGDNYYLFTMHFPSYRLQYE